MDTRIALLLLASISVTAGSNGSTVDEFEKAVAVSQKFLDLGCVLYDRLDRERCAYQAGAELVRADYAILDLEELTKHRDPRVRTLAIVCLFNKGNPLRALILRINAWLPTPLVEWPYASLTDDEKKTVFPELRKIVRDSVPRWK